MTSSSRRDSIPHPHYYSAQRTRSSSLFSRCSQASTSAEGHPSRQKSGAGRSRTERPRSLETRVSSNLDDTEPRKREKLSSGKSSVIKFIWMRLTKFRYRIILQFRYMCRVARPPIKETPPRPSTFEIQREWKKLGRYTTDHQGDSPVPGRFPGYLEGGYRWMRFID